jgi:hydrogenase maturation protease
MVCNKGVQTLIVCLGNERVCDDGIGARVGRILQSLPLPSDVTIAFVQSVRLQLLDQLAEADRVILVDALSSGAEAGTCTVADVTEIPAAIACVDCAHAKTVANVMDLVRHVSCDGGMPQIDIAGIEGKQFLACGGDFSEEVNRATPRLVDLLLLTVGAGLSARRMVKDVWRGLYGASEPMVHSWPIPEVRRDVTGL